VIGPVAWAVRQLLAETAIDEHGDDQQDDRCRHLDGGDQGPAPAASSSGCDDIAGLDHGGQIRARRLERRHEAEDHRAHDGHGNAEGERPEIHLERQQNGQLRRNLDLPEQQHSGVADPQPQHAARNRDEHAFGNQLPNDAAAARADREAKRDLARAQRRAARQQPGDVAARHQQDGNRQRRQHRDQHGVRRALGDARLQLRVHEEPLILVRLRIRALEVGCDRGQLALGLLLRGAALQPPFQPEIPDITCLERSGLCVVDERRGHHHRYDEIGAHELIHPRK